MLMWKIYFCIQEKTRLEKRNFHIQHIYILYKHIYIVIYIHIHWNTYIRIYIYIYIYIYILFFHHTTCESTYDTLSSSAAKQG